jgi:hypothetical protein
MKVLIKSLCRLQMASKFGYEKELRMNHQPATKSGIPQCKLTFRRFFVIKNCLTFQKCHGIQRYHVLSVHSIWHTKSTRQIPRYVNIAGADEWQLTNEAIASYFFYVITVAGLLVLRYTEPKISRPYKAFTILPIFFVAVGSFVVIRETISSPISGAIFLAISITAGILHCFKTGTEFRVWDRIKYKRLT